MSMRLLTESLIHQGVLRSPEIVEAFLRIDRADFVPSDQVPHAYVNEPLSIGYGQTISQPLTVAFMLEALQPRPGNNVLDIGAGSGWQSALLAAIVGKGEPNGHVVALELIPELAAFARQNIAKYNFLKKGVVEVHCLNAEEGFAARAPYDRIIAAAATHVIPPAWKEQLKVGGVLVAPVDNMIIQMRKISSDHFEEVRHEGFAFVPFVKRDDFDEKDHEENFS